MLTEVEAVDYADGISSRLEKAQGLTSELFEQIDRAVAHGQADVSLQRRLEIMSDELREALELTERLSLQLLGRAA